MALNEQVFVIVSNSNGVQVFNTRTLVPEPIIPVFGLSDPTDIAGKENFLYIGSSKGKVFRIDIRDKSITSWSVRGGKGRVSLSVNQQGHVIATKMSFKIASNNIYEYTSTGELRREIALKGDVVDPYRAVHIDGDQFLVCHVERGADMHRVCLIDNQGNLIKSFGSTHGSGNANLWRPCRLVVDRNGFILVADSWNNRLVVLNKQMEYVQDIIPTSIKLYHIDTLFLDEDNSRLFLSDNCNSNLAVFDFEARIYRAL